MTREDLTEQKVAAPKADEAAQIEDVGFARRLRQIYSHSTFRSGEDRRLFARVLKARPYQSKLIGQHGRPADVLAHIDAAFFLHDAERAQERMVQGVEQYVVREAKKLLGRGVELEDLINEGITGVMRALETYNPKKGYAFLTYADDWIRQRMLRACEREGSIERYGSRIPCHQYMANGRVTKVIDKMREELNRDPTPEELATRAKLQNVQQAETALDLLSRSFTSLDSQRPSDDSEVTVADAIADPQAINPVEETMMHERANIVMLVFSRLSPEEQQVFAMRNGLAISHIPGADGTRHTQEQVCRALGIKKSRLVALQNSAEAQLKASAELRDIKDEMLSAIAT